MKNFDDAEQRLVVSYMAAVYSCIGQMAFEEDGRKWNCDAFKNAREHPIHERPDLLDKATKMLEHIVGHHWRGKAALERLKGDS